MYRMRQQGIGNPGSRRILETVWVRALYVLCLAMLFLAGCSVSPTGQEHTGRLAVQAAPQARITYVAIGASDTYGTGSKDPRTESWPAVLSRMLAHNGDGKMQEQSLGQNTVRLINLGIPGMHAHDALGVELPVAIDAHPNLITVWLAVNDLVDNVPPASYAKDLERLLQDLQTRLPHVRIAIANVPDLTLLPRFSSNDTTQLARSVASYNAVIQSVVDRYHVVLIDLFQAWHELASHQEFISDDGFHPSAAGYARLAQLFYQGMKQHRII